LIASSTTEAPKPQRGCEGGGNAPKGDVAGEEKQRPPPFLWRAVDRPGTGMMLRTRDLASFFHADAKEVRARNRKVQRKDSLRTVHYKEG